VDCLKNELSPHTDLRCVIAGIVLPGLFIRDERAASWALALPGLWIANVGSKGQFYVALESEHPDNEEKMDGKCQVVTGSSASLVGHEPLLSGFHASGRALLVLMGRKLDDLCLFQPTCLISVAWSPIRSSLRTTG